jgi:ribosomal-protein-alanine N-acetyltransferase
VIVAETSRLRIRHFTLDDGEFILRLLNEPTFIQNIVDKGVRTLDAARAYLRDGPMASYQRHGFGLNCVELRDSRVPIGMCGLIKRDSLEDADLGYALLPEHCSKGYAAEAATAVMATAGGEFGMRRVVAVTNAENERSIRLLERMGFRYERMISLQEGEAEIKLYASAVGPSAEGER